MDQQDAVKRGRNLFETPTTFEKEFPMIAVLEIKADIRKDGPMQARGEERFFNIAHPPGEYLRCPRTNCVHGGWRVGDALRDMTSNGDTERQTGGICTGRERMNRTMSRECLTLFRVNIKIVYKDSMPKS